MKILYFIVGLSLIFSTSAEARRKKKKESRVSLIVSARYYADILQRAETDPLIIGPDASVNLEIKAHKIFSFILTGGQAFDQSRLFYGAGLRINLPGFFMFGGSLFELTLEKRRTKVVTYTSYTALVTELPGQDFRLIANRYSLGVDVSLGSSVFLNLEPSLYSHGGNQFISAGVGLGIEF